MLKYRCIKELFVPIFDEDGSRIENEHFGVKVGSVWERSDSSYRITAGKESVRLINEIGEWIEIYSLNEHFIKLA